MSIYRELLDAKAELERTEFRERQEEQRRQREKRLKSGAMFEAVMSTFLRAEFDEFVKALEAHKFPAKYLEQEEGGLPVRARVIFRLDREEGNVPLSESNDCCMWITLDVDNGVVEWDYHGDLPQHENEKLQTGKLADLGAECGLALRDKLSDCLAACLKGHRVTNLR